MRRAKPQELKTRAVPAMTARLTESELLKWLPVSFDEITDPLATPEPSKGALVQLDSGGYVVLYYGKDSQQLILEIPEVSQNSSALVASFFSEVSLPVSRVLWHRPDISLPRRSGHSRQAGDVKRSRAGKSVSPVSAPSKRSARRVSLPRKGK